MPQRAKRVCRGPGCSDLVDGDYCLRHAHERGLAARDFDRRRGSAAKRGYGRRHERWRRMVLARDPLCKIAKLCDGTALSTEADHVVPLSQGGTWELENGQG